MSVTDADRIAAAGIPLTLGGREVRVRYTLRSWKEAEDRFGSTEKAFAVLRGIGGIEDDRAAKIEKDVGTVIALLWMGLLHEGLTEDDVYELGHLSDFPTYRNVILEAVNEGVPRPGPGKEEAAASPGAPTTTPSPSDSAAVMASSGA
jgi:hypothetical protein